MSHAAEQHLASAVSYLRAYEQHDLDAIARHLHPDVRYEAPVARLNGKAAVLEAARRFSATLAGVTVKSRFAAGDQVMVAYELRFPEPIGVQPAAQLLTFRDGLIAEVQAFFDPRPFAPGAGRP